MNTPAVIVLFIGIPGSGKTTFARQLATKLDAVVLNSDGFRMAMWRSLDAIRDAHTDPMDRRNGNLLTFGAMNYAAEQIVSAGKSVVYDCNANHSSERLEKHEIAARHSALSIVVRIRVPYETSLQRVQERAPTSDQRRLPLEDAATTLDRFIAEIEEPTSDEHTVEIPGDIAFEEQYGRFKDALDVLISRQNQL